MEKGPLWLRSTLAVNGVTVDDRQMDLLQKYSRLLLEWNEKINLISRRSVELIWEEQMLHSLSFLGRRTFEDSKSVIDIGTGGGLPGIPIKIMRPDLEVTLLDSIGKKVEAVRAILTGLGMSGIEAECGRAEELLRANSKHKRYDYAVCRGVGELADLWSYGYPLLWKIPNGTSMKIHDDGKPAAIPAGSVVALKGGDITEELRDLERKKKGVSITVIEINLKTDEPLKNPEKKVVILTGQTR